MKKFVVCAAAALAVSFSSGAMAQAGGYFSAAVGFGNVNANCSGAPSCDRGDTAFKMVGGYDFGSGLAAEVGYIDFGKARLSGPGLTIDVNASAVTIGAALRAPLSSAAGLNLRLGVANVQTKVEVKRTFSSGSDSESKAALYYGLGFNYAINRNTRLEVGVDFSRSEYRTEKADLRAITLGARFTL